MEVQRKPVLISSSRLFPKKLRGVSLRRVTASGGAFWAVCRQTGSNPIGCRAKSVTISVRWHLPDRMKRNAKETRGETRIGRDCRSSRIRRSFPPHGALRITLRSCSSYRDFQRLRGRPPLVSPLKSWSAAALAEASFCAALTSRSWLNAFVLVIGTLTSAERAAARFTSLKNSLRRCGSSSHLAVLLDVW